MSSYGPTLPIVRGTDRDFPLVSTSDGTTPNTFFLSSDTLTARVWAGDDQPVLFTPAVAWLDATLAHFQVTVTAAQSAPLDPGLYSLQVLAARAGRSVVLLDGALEVTQAPGSAASRRVYCSYADLRRKAAWLDQVEFAGRFQEGFLAQRVDAADRLDMAIATAYRGNSVGLFNTHSIAGFLWAGGGPRRSKQPAQVVLDQLAAGALMLRPKVIDVVAWWSIAEVGLAHIGSNNVWAAFGQYARDQGDSIACSLVAELDTNGDGVCEIPIELGTTNTLYT